MREIIFRGKIKSTNEWIFSTGYIKSDNRIFLMTDSADIITGEWLRDGEFTIEVIPETVGQFTGLKDKNGKEIYEGDIVKHVREIEWSDDYHTGEPSDQNRTITRIGETNITTRGARLNGTKLEVFEDEEKKNTFCKWSGNLTCWSEMSEVIGNIYENPQLLK